MRTVQGCLPAPEQALKCESTGGRIGKWGKTRPATGAAGGHPHARLITRTLNEVTT